LLFSVGGEMGMRKERDMGDIDGSVPSCTCFQLKRIEKSLSTLYGTKYQRKKKGILFRLFCKFIFLFQKIYFCILLIKQNNDLRARCLF
jgi:hypothetical protein